MQSHTVSICNNNLIMICRLLRSTLKNQKSWKREIATSNSVKYCKSNDNTHKEEHDNRPEYEIPDDKLFLTNPIKYVRMFCTASSDHVCSALHHYKKVYENGLTKLPHIPIQGEANIVWKFDGDPKALDNWMITCDSDEKHGYSTAKQELSPDGKLVFSGVLETKVPKDGIQKRAGYCNISTKPFLTPFLLKETALNWDGYTHLLLRLRGDGRAYAINIGNRETMDIFFYDIYSYVCYTRGGPYWQLVQLPFSKFVFTPGGMVQDRQNKLHLENITGIGITVCDKINGPFRLEIDYIGVMCNNVNDEKFAYEQYRTDVLTA